MKSKQKKDKLYEAAVATANEWVKEIRSTKPRLEVLRYFAETLNKRNSFLMESTSIIDLKGFIAIGISLGIPLTFAGVLMQGVFAPWVFVGMVGVSCIGVLFGGAAICPRKYLSRTISLEDLTRKSTKKKNKLRYDSISREEREYWKIRDARYVMEYNGHHNIIKLRYLNGCFVCIILNFVLLGTASAVQLLYSWS